MRIPRMTTRTFAHATAAALAVTIAFAAAGAQVTGTLSQPTVTASTQPVMLSPTAVAAFRSGMKATMLASNSILKPLGLAWVPYPLTGSRYRVIRAAASSGPWVNASDALVPVTDTIRGLPPNTTVYVRVVALANRSGSWVAVDTTSPAVAITAPIPDPVQMIQWYDSCERQPIQPTCYFVVSPIACRTALLAPSTITIDWPRELGAHDYVVTPSKLLTGSTSSFTALTAVTVTDTSFTLPNASAGQYRFRVQSRYLVRDWPGPGQQLIVQGASGSGPFLPSRDLGVTVPAPSPPTCT